MQSWDSWRRRTGLVIVLSGPSGVGKDSILKQFVRVCPDVAHCATFTTRAPRPGEREGKPYHFVSADEFGRMAQSGSFLEYAEVHGNMYGTPRGWVLEETSAGRDVILKIDVQGGIAVKKQLPEAVLVFVAPPSMRELERRLRSRLTESEAEVAKRLGDARVELEKIPHYDYLITNAVVRDAVDKLRAIVVAERCRVAAQG
jgi:guanylate kinase